MKQEHIDVTAPDPFTADRDHAWKPTKIYKNYQQCEKELCLPKSNEDSKSDRALSEVKTAQPAQVNVTNSNGKLIIKVTL